MDIIWRSLRCVKSGQNRILGVHLHLLLSLSYLPKHSYYLPIMITAGWAYPLMLVLGHLIHVSYYLSVSKIKFLQIKVKRLNSCYAKGYGLQYWNEIPIVIMLVINFEIFVLVVKKISSKLLPSKKSTKTSPSLTRAPSLRRGNKNNVNLTRMNRTSPTLRLAKATLTLIPVMGMQNLIFILIPSQGKTSINHPTTD